MIPADSIWVRRMLEEFHKTPMGGILELFVPCIDCLQIILDWDEKGRISVCGRI